MDLGWIVILAAGVVFLFAARPIAVRTINSYPRMSPEKKARTIPAQTTANRIGGIVFVILGIVGLLKPTFMK